MTGILSVRQLTDRLKLLIEKQFPYVWVQGEVTNLTRPASGHVYFSLKDGDAVLACVWFRGRQKTNDHDPLTGEVYEDGPRLSLAQSLQNGQTLVCAGQLSLYTSRGSCQLIVDLAQDAGQGLLHQQLEELKRTLLAEGVFDPARKRPLPQHPVRVAVITSPTGAAVRDFVRIAATRGMGSRIRIYPALVQGDEAPGSLLRALERACTDTWGMPPAHAGKNTPANAADVTVAADVVVLLRGGGSLEDLWAFNNADLARALSRAPMPILTGIGHEIDTSIADLVADMRAATPSHAAQLLWPEREWYAQRIDDLTAALYQSMHRQLTRREEQTRALERGLAWLSPVRQLHRMDERVTGLIQRLRLGMDGVLRSRTERLSRQMTKLEHCGGETLVQRPNTRLEQALWRLHAAGRTTVEASARRCEHAEAGLSRLDPLAPLERGYALVRDADGRFVRSIADVRPGDTAAILVRDGMVDATITGVRPTP